jgi:hypothetical protein
MAGGALRHPPVHRSMERSGVLWLIWPARTVCRSTDISGGVIRMAKRCICPSSYTSYRVHSSPLPWRSGLSMNWLSKTHPPECRVFSLSCGWWRSSHFPLSHEWVARQATLPWWWCGTIDMDSILAVAANRKNMERSRFKTMSYFKCKCIQLFRYLQKMSNVCRFLIPCGIFTFFLPCW